MRKVSMAMRAELVEVVRERYRTADRRSKGRILDEVVSRRWWKFEGGVISG